MNRARRRLAAALLALPLASCGYYLRGSTPDSQLAFDSVYLDAPSGTPLERDLRTSIRSQRTAKLVNDPKTAKVSLRVLSDKQERKVLTLNSQGQVFLGRALTMREPVVRNACRSCAKASSSPSVRRFTRVNAL